MRMIRSPNSPISSRNHWLILTPSRSPAVSMATVSISSVCAWLWSCLAGFDFQIEGAQVEDRADVDVGISRLADTRGAVEISQLEFQLRQIFRIDQIDLVEQHHVGEGDLFFGFRRTAQLLQDMFGVDHGDDAVQSVFALDPIVDEKALHHRRRIGQSRGLDHQGVELFPVFEQLKQAAQQIAANAAADAAVAHLDHFLVRRDQQMMIDADLAELIDDDGDAPAMVGGQDAIE